MDETKAGQYPSMLGAASSRCEHSSTRARLVEGSCPWAKVPKLVLFHLCIGFAKTLAGPRLAALGLVAALVLAAAPAAAQAPEGGTVKAQHGDWQVVCKPPPPGAKNEVCALVQSVTAEDRNNIGLTVYFQKFSDGKRVLRVFAPLGVLLPPGLGLKIDDKDVGHAPFVRCHNFACYAQVVVEPPLIEQLKTGKTAVFIIFQTEEAGIGIPISLAGFSQALAALQ
jgi:invasion protein IalB